jgi:hypothetical protein
MPLQAILNSNFEQHWDVDTRSVSSGCRNKRVWSLQEIMNQFDLLSLSLLLYKLNILQHRYEIRVEQGNGGQDITEQEIVVLVRLAQDAKQYGIDAEFPGVVNGADLLEHRLNYPKEYNSAAIAVELRNFEGVIVGEIRKNKFLQVDAKVVQYLDQEAPFGEAVNKAFPSASTDIVAAGNCLAVELNTAAAFHLMRAAEVGLWELGRDRQIPCAKAGAIEFKEWGMIIGELDEAVRAIQQWPNSRVKEEAHKFYNAAVVEIRAFNDGWRRHSAHARPHMPKMETDEAIALWGHVSRFMNTLATKIGEGSYTPLRWT